MRKIFLILFSFALLVAVACSTAERQDVKPQKTAVQQVDAWQTASADQQGVFTYADNQAALDAQVMLVQDIDPPNADYGDVLQIPGKDSSKSDWFYWGISAAVLVLWEVVFRLVPTSKSVSILTMLYNLFNLLIKDKSDSGGIFKIKEVKKE